MLACSSAGARSYEDGRIARSTCSTRPSRSTDSFSPTDRIESFEVCLLDPHGGELAGFALLRGSEDQIDSVRRDEAFQREMTKASLIVDDLGMIGAALGEGLARAMSIYQEEIAVVA